MMSKHGTAGSYSHQVVVTPPGTWQPPAPHSNLAQLPVLGLGLLLVTEFFCLFAFGY